MKSKMSTIVLGCDMLGLVSCSVLTMRSGGRSIICSASVTRGDDGVEIRAQHVELEFQALRWLTYAEACIPVSSIESE